MFNFLTGLTNLQQRLIVGFVGAVAIISGVYINQWSYFLLFFAICYFSLNEFHGLINVSGVSTNKLYGITLGLMLFTISFFVVTGYFTSSAYFYFMVVVFILFLLELFQNNLKPFERTAYALLAVVYTALPYTLLNYAVFKSGSYNYKIIAGIFLLLWANDTGGYFGGKFFGKHKLYERISPKKTWEGSIAGLILSLSIAYGLFLVFGEFSLPFWLGLSAIIVVAGSLGDLVESQLKRSLSIKDSGSSIPGHGGFLDRFDGLIVSLPFVVIYFEIV